MSQARWWWALFGLGESRTSRLAALEAELGEALLREIPLRFPGLPKRVQESPRWELRIAAPNPAIGCVRITLDGDEAALFIGELTHGHFGPGDRPHDAENPAGSITDSVCRLLEALFDDRVVVWRLGTRGGWRVIEAGEKPQLPRGAEAHTWSGRWG